MLTITSIDSAISVYTEESSRKSALMAFLITQGPKRFMKVKLSQDNRFTGFYK
jgi:hypothetical protein